MRVVVAGATGHEITRLSRQRGTDLLDRAAVIDLVTRSRAEAGLARP